MDDAAVEAIAVEAGADETDAVVALFSDEVPEVSAIVIGSIGSAPS